MQINPVAATTSSSIGRTTQAALARQNLLHGGPGVLTPADHKMLQAASGLTFHWPTLEDEAFPEEAVDIASMRAQQLAAGVRIKELTPADLTKMLLAGTVSEEFARNATAYLQNGTVAPAKTPASFGAAAAATTSASVRAAAGNGARVPLTQPLSNVSHHRDFHHSSPWGVGSRAQRPMSSRT